MAVELFVPGRVCLLGEHSDWASGYMGRVEGVVEGKCLVAATARGIFAQVDRSDKLELSTQVVEREPLIVAMEVESLKEVATGGGFWRYVAGVAAVVKKDQPKIGGLTLNNYKVDLPMGKGLSSSAAVCVLTARAFNQAYELGRDVFWEMEMAYRGEMLSGSMCGRMDQTCGYPEQPVVVSFSGDEVKMGGVRAGGDIYLVLVDLMGSKNTVKILQDLNLAMAEEGHAEHKNLVELLGRTNQRLVGEASVAIDKGDMQELGQVMMRAQREFDRVAGAVCPEELTSPKLHRLLTEPKLKPYIWGGKGVGSQGDGTAQLLAKSEADQTKLIGLVEQMGVKGLALTIRARD